MGWWNRLTSFISVRESVELQCWKLRDYEGGINIYLYFLVESKPLNQGSCILWLFLWKTVESSVATVRSLFCLLCFISVCSWRAKAWLDGCRDYGGMRRPQPWYAKDCWGTGRPSGSAAFAGCIQQPLISATNICELWSWEILKMKNTWRLGDRGSLLGEDEGKEERWWDGCSIKRAWERKRRGKDVVLM